MRNFKYTRVVNSQVEELFKTIPQMTPNNANESSQDYVDPVKRERYNQNRSHSNSK